MAGKTVIGGVAYDIKAGKTLIGGVAYDIKAGKTLVGGVGYDVKFGGMELTLSGADKTSSTIGRWVEVNGETILEDGVYPVEAGDSIKVYLCMLTGSRSSPNRILLNGTQVATGYNTTPAEYTFSAESSVNVSFTSVGSGMRVSYWKAEITTED